MEILCVVSQKKLQLLPDPHHPLTLLGDFRPLDPQSSFMSPNNPVRLTTLLINIAALRHFRHITTQKSVQLQGASPPYPLTRGLCPLIP